MSETSFRTSGPLNGIRVIELGSLIAGPFASRLLAEFGSDVIKIESKDGDPLRKWRVLHQGTSLWWRLQARNKRLVSLDLKTEEGIDIVRRLISTADVLIENFRPGFLEKLGLGWDQLSTQNPNLVMVRISGFGQTGPERDRPGFGAIGEALGGLRYTTGTSDRPPARVGVSIGDSLASLHAAFGALMCLLRVKTGQGKGQVVDVSLHESVFNIMESLIPEYDLAGITRERAGARLPGICPSNSYCTRDGVWVVIAGNSDPIYRRLMSAIDRSDLAEDPRLQTNDGRVAHETTIDRALTDWIGTRTYAEVAAAMTRAEVPSDRIYSAADIIAHPQYQARDMLLKTELPDGAVVTMPGISPKLSETPGEQRWIGGEIGSHTGEVLHELGFSGAEQQRLRESGIVVGEAPPPFSA